MNTMAMHASKYRKCQNNSAKKVHLAAGTIARAFCTKWYYTIITNIGVSDAAMWQYY